MVASWYIWSCSSLLLSKDDDRNRVLCIMQNAVSVFCRLGFAKKKSVSTESGGSETFHDSWKNLEQQNIITKKCVIVDSLFHLVF